MKELFYKHDDESFIRKRKDKEELINWTNHLEFIINELNLFLKIEKRLLNKTEVNKTINDLRNQNAIVLKNLYRYDISLNNSIECDTVDCDTFYLSTHEKNRQEYLNFVEKVHLFKMNFYRMILD
ncbi:hypothetical protein [Joostella sp. CR20]|uniref:hypothetical protein n=1 Tax=Joostella sp. CR20 TaxID=2804312 RepID=UPI00313F070F